MCRVAEAQRFLKAASWRLEPALDGFFNDASSSKPFGVGNNQVSPVTLTRNLEKLWTRYAGTCSPGDNETKDMQQA